jgi:hypothetical protein
MSPMVTQRLVALAHDIEGAPQGQKTGLCEAAARELGLSLATVYRKLKEVTLMPSRKRRTDADTSILTHTEAQLISAVLIQSIRNNDKQLSTLERAVERLRTNGKILAARVDAETGEIQPLSLGAIGRALRVYGLHPDQILRPTPAVELRSAHPNHVWQIDASISTQFYLDDKGTQAMSKAEFYDGKPSNLKRIERQRLWRYVITDHTSGVIYLQYVLGAESAENLIDVLVCAMHKRGEMDPFHGVPLMIMTDPGAAMTSAPFRNLCRALSIELIINKVGNARAKGQVEQAHNIVEREFESGLRLQEKVRTLHQINDLAGRWMRLHNATAIHTRHHRTRYGMWLTISAQQLRLAPGIEICRELSIAAPELRKVNGKLRVSFRGGEFDVASVPGVEVHDKILITRNPWRDAESAQVVILGEDGRDTFHVVERITRDQNGFAETSRMIGAEYAALPETPSQKAKKMLDQLATGTTSVEAAERALKAKAVPFGGEIDPFKQAELTQLPTWLPKRGTDLEVRTTVATVEARPLTHIEAAKRLRNLLGEAWTAESLAWLKAEHPEGVPEDQLDAIAQQLKTPVRPALRVVGGNA